MSADASGYPTQVVTSGNKTDGSEESDVPQNATSTQDSVEADKAQAKCCQEPLHWAAENSHVDAVDVLLRAGASVEAKDKNGHEPLQLAAENGHVDVVYVLLGAGASVEVKDKQGREPLHQAAANGHVDVVDVLLDAKASVDAKDISGKTALHSAVEGGKHDVVEWLLAAGANVVTVDTDGWTPLHHAAKEGHAAIVERLLVAGASVDAVDNYGMTPYDLAKREGHAMVLGWLKPVWVRLGIGGNKVCRCNSHLYKTFKGLKDKVQKHFGVKIRALVGPNGELLFDASDEDSWKLSPWESKIDIDNGDEITAIVDNPQHEPESDD